MTRAVAIAALLIGLASPAFAETRWAVIISGASGGDKYAEQILETLRPGLTVERYRGSESA